MDNHSGPFRFEYTGPSGDRSWCDVETYEGIDGIPVVAAIERSDNPGTSVINAAELIAGTIMARARKACSANDPPFRFFAITPRKNDLTEVDPWELPDEMIEEVIVNHYDVQEDGSSKYIGTVTYQTIGRGGSLIRPRIQSRSRA